LETKVRRIHPQLPLFLIEFGPRNLVYTPGSLSVLTPEESVAAEEAWKGHALSDRFARLSVTLESLEHGAETALDEYRSRMLSPFAPECLTVYLSNFCNLNCPYCFASQDSPRSSISRYPVSREQAILDEKAIEAAARFVIDNCRLKNKPFVLAVHGGGEPTVHWDVVKRIRSLTVRLAAESGVEWRGYIATNGVLTTDPHTPGAIELIAERAGWLARNFDTVGLSCDGPPEIQDRLRPLREGRSSLFVERTADAVREAGGCLEVRATITPETVALQSEIVEYLFRRLGASQVRFEPVYRAGNGGFRLQDASDYLRYFLAAQKRARELGCSLDCSGVRLDEPHGPYCDILSNNLRMVPGGSVTTCFVQVDSRNGADRVIGHYDRQRSGLDLDFERIASYKQEAQRIPNACHDCLNQLHCARSCPDHCTISSAGRATRTPETQDVSDVYGATEQARFRCVVNRQLAVAWILEAAREIESEERRSPDIVVQGETSNQHRTGLAELLRSAPEGIDRAGAAAQWETARLLYPVELRQTPGPVWTKQPWEIAGATAWTEACRRAAADEGANALSIYLHVPLCEGRCKFCGCLADPLAHHEPTRAGFVTALLSEIDLWVDAAPALACRPATTVHWGGGTPLSLGQADFAKLSDRLVARLGISSETEIAVESTSRDCTPENLAFLRSIGCRRLHVGVQTLEKDVRKHIGRRENPQTVLRRLRDALETGFAVSVDLIYGLPGQSLAGLVDTVRRLIALGIHGFSLYRLGLSNRNRRAMNKLGASSSDPLPDFTFLAVLEQILLENGYCKNHFDHYARPEDRSLYLRHALRGEDLLAFGPTADGVFSDFVYRHTGLAAYLRNCPANGPALEGGITKPLALRAVERATAALMCGYFEESLIPDLHVRSLLERWLSHGLLRREGEETSYTLTASGSWCVDFMIHDVERMSAAETSV